MSKRSRRNTRAGGNPKEKDQARQLGSQSETSTRKANSVANDREEPTAWQHAATQRGIALRTRRLLLRCACCVGVVVVLNAIMVRTNGFVQAAVTCVVLVACAIAIDAVMCFGGIELMRFGLRRATWQKAKGADSPVFFGPFRIGHVFCAQDDSAEFVRVSRPLVKAAVVTRGENGETLNEIWFVRCGRWRMIASPSGGGAPMFARRIPIGPLRRNLRALPQTTSQ